jgi:hypothetical protein
MRPRLILAIAWILVLATGCAYQPPAPVAPTAQPTGERDLSAFKDMIGSAECSDISNKLYLIDGDLVFWDVRGKCSDASYSYTLFGDSPDDVLCQRHDSIAGPGGACRGDVYRQMLDTIAANLDKPDLGLGPDHTVVPIPL